MSVLDAVVQFHLDRPDGPLVGTTVSRKQSYIAGLLRGLAEKYPGREVHAVYPPERCPECGGIKHQPLCQWFAA